MVSHTDIRAILQHLGWNTNLQVLDIEHAIFGITHRLGMMQHRATPLLAVNVLRADSQQLADGILYSTNVAAGIDNLSLYAQVRSLHLVHCGAICLAVLPQRLLCIKRLVPQTVGLREDFQLTVEHLQH